MKRESLLFVSMLVVWALLSSPGWSMPKGPRAPKADGMLRKPTQKRKNSSARLASRRAQRSHWKGCGGLCRQKLYRMPKRRIERLLRYAQKRLTYAQRLLLFGELFLGGRYKFGPLGEGRRGRYDRDPTFRLDQVDCLTYIETVMALAMSGSLREARHKLQQIRYKDGKIRYDHRNHFTAPQWLVENGKLGFIKPITREIGGHHSRPYLQKVTPGMWRWSRWGKRLPARLRPRTYTVWYVPLEKIKHIQHRLPALAWMGEIFDKPEHPSSIRHVGFLLRKRKTLYFRHANIGKRGVREEPLAGYTRWRLRYYTDAKKSKYKILGYTFSEFVEPVNVRRQRRTKP